MQLSKKRKAFLYQLLKPSYLLQAMDSDADEFREKEFKQNTGFTFKQADDAVDALLEYLKKS